MVFNNICLLEDLLIIEISWFLFSSQLYIKHQNLSQKF